MIIMCYLGTTGRHLSLSNFVTQCKNNNTMKDIDYYVESDESDSPEEFATFVDNLQYTIKDCNIYINYDKSVLMKLIQLGNKPLAIIPKATDVMKYLEIYKSYKPGLDIIMRKRFFNDITWISTDDRFYVYSLSSGKTIKDSLNDIYRCIGEINNERK